MLSSSKSDQIRLLDDFMNVLQKIAIPLLPLAFIIAVAAQHYSENGSITGWPKTVLQSVFSICTSLVAALLISLVAKPIYDRYTKLRSHIQEEQKVNNLHNLIEQSLLPISSQIVNIERLLSDAAPPVNKFFDTFHDIDWKVQLEGATKVDLAVFYWSTDWLSKNLQFFEKEVAHGMLLNIYLPHPASFQSNFIQGGHLTSRATNKIIQTAVLFEHKLSVIPNGKYNLYFVNHGINYMFARIEKGIEAFFIFSPFQGSTDSIASKPPAISINEFKSNDEIRGYIKFELEHLRKGKLLSEIDVPKYLAWEAGRVIVSPNLTCPGKCAFCYVESLRDTAVHRSEIKPMGRLIASYLATDAKFVPGKHGTAILIGGMSDPFHNTNADTTIDIIRTLCDEGTDAGLTNIIHISTRHCIDNIKIITELAQYNNVVLNYSICSIDGEYEMGAYSIKKRFAEAKVALQAGITTGIYLRPVIPGITINHVEALIEQILNLGVKFVTVGGLYVDARIINRLKKYSIPTLYNFEKTKKHVLDQRGLLQKVADDDTEKIIDAMKTAGLTTFKSSMDLVRHLQTGAMF